MKKTPVSVIGFVRDDLLERTLLNLSQCEGVLERDVCVYLSAPRHEEEKSRTDKVLSLVKRFQSESLPNIIIIQRDKNEGAGGNIRHAITETLKRDEGRVIVIEDDVLVSRTFLRYMDAALDYYENDSRIWCINGHRQPYHEFPKKYPYDVYLNPRNMAWGWGVWRSRWESVDFSMRDYLDFTSKEENRQKLASAGADLPIMIEAVLKKCVDTWDVQCSYHMVKHDLYAVEGVYSQTKNIGFCRSESVNCTRPNGILSNQKYYNFIPCLAPTDEMLRCEQSYWDFFKYNVSERRPLRLLGRMLLRYLSFYFGKQNLAPFEV